MIQNSLATNRNQNPNIDSTNHNINTFSFSNYSEDNDGYYNLIFVSGSPWVQTLAQASTRVKTFSMEIG